MYELALILAAAVAGYAQGNGHAGPGRVALFITLLVCGWYGPLNGVGGIDPSTAAIVVVSALMYWTTAGGHTKWQNWKYGLVLRYSQPAALAAMIGLHWTGQDQLLLLALAGPICTAVFYFVGEHKPDWLIRLVGGRDVARPLACAVTAGLLVV